MNLSGLGSLRTGTVVSSFGTSNLGIEFLDFAANRAAILVTLPETPGKILTDIDAPGILRLLGFNDDDAPLRSV